MVTWRSTSNRHVFVSSWAPCVATAGRWPCCDPILIRRALLLYLTLLLSHRGRGLILAGPALSSSKGSTVAEESAFPLWLCGILFSNWSNLKNLDMAVSEAFNLPVV